MEISPQQLLSGAIYILDFQNSNTGPEEEKQDFVLIVVEDLPLVRNFVLTVKEQKNKSSWKRQPAAERVFLGFVFQSSWRCLSTQTLAKGICLEPKRLKFKGNY